MHIDTWAKKIINHQDKKPVFKLKKSHLAMIIYNLRRYNY